MANTLCWLITPLAQLPDRICELNFHLIDRYMELGEDFMKRFYTTDNQALSAYHIPYFLISSDCPVISDGFSRPIISSSVGATSARRPPSLRV